jgi:molybdenum cofactor cytidylyltransferase
MAPKVGALLLAAGASQRMGQIKQLLPVPDEPAIRCCIRQMRAGGIDTIVVVLGNHREAIEPVIADLPVRLAFNPRTESHMADSVSCGLALLPADISGVLVSLCDHPLVSAGTFATLTSTHQHNPQDILLPVHKGKGGHPTLFPRDLCQAVDKGTPLNQVVHANPHCVQRLSLEDPGLTRDMDTPEDYQQLLQLARQEGFPQQ